MRGNSCPFEIASVILSAAKDLLLPPVESSFVAPDLDQAAPRLLARKVRA
jgi:hypothetical protein